MTAPSVSVHRTSWVVTVVAVVVQVLVPLFLDRSAADRVPRFGWAMFTRLVEQPRYVVETADGEVEFTIRDFATVLRSDLDYASFAPAHLCREVAGLRQPIGLDLARLQVSIVFCWTAMGKANANFLSGDLLGLVTDGMVDLPSVLRTHAVLVALSLLTVFGEIAVGFGFLFRRTARVALVGAIAFHTSFLLFVSRTADLFISVLAMLPGYLLVWAWSNLRDASANVESPIVAVS